MNFSDGNYIKKIIEELYPFNYSITGNEALKAESVYKRLLNFEIHKFESGSELNGWQIPEGWDVIEAKLKFKNNTIYDCLKDSQLGCAYLSPSFSGKVPYKELLNHLSWREDLPDAIVYDWTRLYRQGIKKWGLSVPWKRLEKFDKNDVEVSIKTKKYFSHMNVYDFLLKGESKKEFIINAHNCHPYQANDDLSGCALGISFLQYLSNIPKRKYSYRLLIGPELFAPMFWLDKLSEIQIKNIKGCLLLKSIGNNSEIKIQNSFYGNSYLDKILSISSKNSNNPSFYPYRTYYGNDETVFEAPGFEIPSITLTRFPFEEYHTHLDNLNNISLSSLEETFNILKETFYILISNQGNSEISKCWNLLMNCLPRRLSQGISIADLSTLYSIPFRELLEYLKKWREKGLATFNKIKI